MKTKILLSIICACSLFKLQAQEWGYVNTLTDEYLRKIWTQGLDTVYIAGENGLIARSTDQGETWEKKYFPTHVNLNDIIFVDYYTGFTVGEQGTILKTSDAGETWEQITLDTSSNINAIAATGLDNIWAVGGNSLILHSTDAGETWEQVNVLLENNIQLFDIAFRGNLGYLTGDYATVYKTEDFGMIWDKQTVIGQTGLSTAAHSINIMENKTYIILGNYLYSTEDQVNWVFTLDINAPLFDANPFFLNDDVGYATLVGIPTGGYGHLFIMKTENGGRQWQIEADINAANFPTQEFSHIGFFQKITMVNETLGYAIFAQVLLKIPAPVPKEGGGRKITDDGQLIISQTSEGELILKSESTPIQSIEIFDMLGKKWIHNQWQNPVWETNLSIGNPPKGAYLIRVIYDNGTVLTDKYLIQ